MEYYSCTARWAPANVREVQKYLLVYHRLWYVFLLDTRYSNAKCNRCYREWKSNLLCSLFKIDLTGPFFSGSSEWTGRVRRNFLVLLRFGSSHLADIHIHILFSRNNGKCMLIVFDFVVNIVWWFFTTFPEVYSNCGCRIFNKVVSMYSWHKALHSVDNDDHPADYSRNNTLFCNRFWNDLQGSSIWQQIYTQNKMDLLALFYNFRSVVQS